MSDVSFPPRISFPQLDESVRVPPEYPRRALEFSGGLESAWPQDEQNREMDAQTAWIRCGRSARRESAANRRRRGRTETTNVYGCLRRCMAACVHIRIDPATKSRLDTLKVHPRETNANVIDRLARQAIDDEPPTDDERADIGEAFEDIEAGRVLSTGQLRREIGL